ncbi:MAG: hypothetical protein ABL912_01640 [Novosphingobium sp.]
MIPFIPYSKKRNTPWTDEDPKLWLLTPKELKSVPRGTVLTSINGTKAIVGTDYIDGDTRFGCLAFGVFDSQIGGE